MGVILNTLYVTEHRAMVGVDHQALMVTVRRVPVGRFPLDGLDAVLLIGKANITTDAIERCARRGVRIASLKQNGAVRFLIEPPGTGNVLLRVAQHRCADNADKFDLARTFVAGKLQNYRRLIGYWARANSGADRRFLDEQRDIVNERLRRLATAATGDQIRGVEGDATRRYFKAVGRHLEAKNSPLRFERRDRRPPRDPFNALLGFLYGLVLTDAVGALQAVGLDHQIGFLHEPRPGRSSLALDLIEELRPLVDRFAVSITTRRQITPDDFVTRAGGACYLSETGRRTLIGLWDEHRRDEERHLLLGRAVPRTHLATVQATLLARHLRGDIPHYPPFVLDL